MPALLFALLIAPAQPAAAQIGFGAPTTVSVRAQAQQTEARPGDSFAIAVVLDHEAGFHTWPDRAQIVIPQELGSDFPAIATAVEVSSVSSGLQVGAVQYPATSEVPVDYFQTGNATMLVSFTGQAVAYLPVSVAPEASPGPATVDFNVMYQACDETSCYAPETSAFSIPIEILTAGASLAPAASDPIFEGFLGLDSAGASQGASGANAAQPTSCQPLTTNVFGRSFSFLPCGPAGFLLLLLVAALGGLLLNFTPCVLPVLPLKIMGMSQAAGNPMRLVLLGALMSLGVVSFWMGIGGAIAFVSGFSAISSLFQTTWFSLLVGLVVALMAVGMLGLFEIRLPQAIYRFNPSHDSMHGSFLFGIMTAVLSTPCTAPFMGSAAAWAATRDPAVTLATFGAIGAGMALPYLLLSLRPSLLNKMPRSGPGSVLVKQVMGLFMLSVASFFIGIPVAGWLQSPPDPASRNYWWLVLAFVLIAAGWMVYRGLAITSSTGSTGKRITIAGLGALIAGVGLLLTPGLASHGPIDWVYYTPERLEQAGAEGKIVVLDFTAEWCLNCKALEAAVLHQDPIVALLAQPKVVPMKVDLTGDNPQGRAILQQLGWVGIPLLAVFRPDTGYVQTPLKYDSYTIETILQAVEGSE